MSYLADMSYLVYMSYLAYMSYLTGSLVLPVSLGMMARLSRHQSMTFTTCLDTPDDRLLELKKKKNAC